MQVTRILLQVSRPVQRVCVTNARGGAPISVHLIPSLLIFPGLLELLEVIFV